MPTGEPGQDGYYRNMVVEVGGLASEITSDACTLSAVTINAMQGRITTAALTTAQNAIETITLTNSKIAAADHVNVMLMQGTNTQGTPMLGLVTPAAGSCTIKVINKHASAEALNGTLIIGFQVVKAL